MGSFQGSKGPGARAGHSALRLGGLRSKSPRRQSGRRSHTSRTTPLSDQAFAGYSDCRCPGTDEPQPGVSCRGFSHFHRQANQKWAATEDDEAANRALRPENIDVDLAECDALAEHVNAEIERIVADSKKYTP